MLFSLGLYNVIWTALHIIPFSTGIRHLC